MVDKYHLKTRLVLWAVPLNIKVVLLERQGLFGRKWSCYFNHIKEIYA